MTNRAGRKPASKDPLLKKRKELIEKLEREGFERADIAFIFSVHPAQITRLLK